MSGDDKGVTHRLRDWSRWGDGAGADAQALPVSGTTSMCLQSSVRSGSPLGSWCRASVLFVPREQSRIGNHTESHAQPYQRQPHRDNGLLCACSLHCRTCACARRVTRWRQACTPARAVITRGTAAWCASERSKEASRAVHLLGTSACARSSLGHSRCAATSPLTACFCCQRLPARCCRCVPLPHGCCTVPDPSAIDL